MSENKIALRVDMETYLSQLEDWDISEDEKEEFISTLWALLLNFAELGFEIHPVQLAQKDGGKSLKKNPQNINKTHSFPCISVPDVLYSPSMQRTQIITNSEACSAKNVREESS